MVTRYVNQLRYEKRDVRQSRMLHRQSAIEAYHKRFASHSTYDSPLSSGFRSPSGDVKDSDGDFEGRGLLQSDLKEYDPYDAFEAKEHPTPLAQMRRPSSPGPKAIPDTPGLYGVPANLESERKAEPS